MMRKTELYKNRICPNKVKCSIVWGGKGKNSVMSIKSLINASVETSTLRGALL
jgi:hypothetical protein